MYEAISHLLKEVSESESLDWNSWLSRFILVIAQSNPSTAIRSVVADKPESASDVFQVSFHAIYNDYQTTNNLREIIFTTFSNILPIAPPKIVEMILQIVQYSLVNPGFPIPIPTTVLARAAEKNLLYSQAIFLWETQLRETSGLPSSECVESLIGLNIKLDMKDSAHGLLRSSIAEYIKVRPDWHERLENWSAALSAYSVKQLSASENDSEFIQGRLRCLSALGEWERILQIPQHNEPYALEFSGNACINLMKWDELDSLLSCHKIVTFDEKILQIANRIAKKQDVQSLIEEAKTSLSFETTLSIVDPQNARLYSEFLKREQLDLLQDIVTFANNKERFKEKWKRRLMELDYSLDVWNRLIPLRTLLLDPFSEDADIWIKFSTLARKKQNWIMSERIVDRLSTNHNSSNLPGVILSRIKNLYVRGNREKAILELEKFLSCAPPDHHLRLLAKCYHALALWISQGPTERVEEFLRKSITFQPDNYKAWSSYALEKFKQTKEMGFGIVHVSETIRALAKCIELCRSNIQDVLRFLSLWFTFYGKDNEIDFQFNNFMENVSVRVWIPALPQILARLRSRRAKLRDAVRNLLLKIGKDSPQSAVFPIAVLSRSDNTVLAQESSSLLSIIRESYPQLVTECELVSSELVRISCTWHERWAALLEEASRLFFVENKKKDDMLRVITSGYTAMGYPSTPSERSFMIEYGPSLARARELIELHQSGQDANNFYLMEAWNIYYEIFQKLHDLNASTNRVDLSSVSPQLFEMKDCSILIPQIPIGDDMESRSRIHSFTSYIDILPSKQKPRVINIIGTDGYSYKFLLKGNEDLKQDERVMQLFKLVNSVVAEAVTSRRRSGVFTSTPGIETLENVFLRRYAVIPLSNNTGLIEWVPSCDTLHSIIKQYRETVADPPIQVAVEHNIMRSKYTRYEDLSLINKLNLFQHALQQTEGMELNHMMFRNAGGNCDKWLKNRLMYSRSLAMTSIVGYILGLGDRHPSNVLIDRETGQVVHVDFGDCFDVTVFRDKYPEKIPLRLTRQLVNALEIAGLEGTFRITCERVMDLIRKNRDTVMAMLEAFIYDPLVTWRLLPNENAVMGGGVDDPSALSWQARAIVDRVHAKILDGDSPIPVQIDRLIREATAHENLCSLYLGYCAFW